MAAAATATTILFFSALSAVAAAAKPPFLPDKFALRDTTAGEADAQTAAWKQSTRSASIITTATLRPRHAMAGRQRWQKRSNNTASWKSESESGSRKWKRSEL